jgi:hypothetical protein
MVALLSFASAKESFAYAQDKIRKEKQSRFPARLMSVRRGCGSRFLFNISSAKSALREFPLLNTFS